MPHSEAGGCHCDFCLWPCFQAFTQWAGRRRVETPGKRQQTPHRDSRVKMGPTGPTPTDLQKERQTACSLWWLWDTEGTAHSDLGSLSQGQTACKSQKCQQGLGCSSMAHLARVRPWVPSPAPWEKRSEGVGRSKGRSRCLLVTRTGFHLDSPGTQNFLWEAPATCGRSSESKPLGTIVWPWVQLLALHF